MTNHVEMSIAHDFFNFMRHILHCYHNSLNRTKTYSIKNCLFPHHVECTLIIHSYLSKKYISRVNMMCINKTE